MAEAETTRPPFAFAVNDKVVKVTGDYAFRGRVVAAFYKLDGIRRRYVVEDDRGLLMIMNEQQIEKRS